LMTSAWCWLTQGNPRLLLEAGRPKTSATSASGDGQISARVDGLQNTTPYAKAGIMLRDGLAADSARTPAPSMRG